MKHMNEVGIRALKQNASEVVAAAAAGRPITVTSRGRPVAALVPLAEDRLSTLITSGLARPATADLADLGPPDPADDEAPSLTAAVLAERSADRY